jgi:hypothetical protein
MSILRSILVCPLLLFLAACAATPPRDYTDPRTLPTAEQRAAFGTIGLAVEGATHPQKPAVPDSMSNAAKAGTTAGVGALGAGYGALAGLSCGPIAPVCVPVFAAAFGVGGLVGSAIGTVPYRTAEQVNSADITLRDALHSVDVEERLAELILAGVPRSPGRNLRRIGYAPEDSPWDAGGDAGADAGDDGAVDTRILIAVPKLSLVALNPSQKRNPDVRLEIVGEGRIFRNHDEAPAFERRWLYDSEVHSYFEWAEDRGALVAAEIDLAVATLGARIIADLLGPELEAVSPVAAEVEPPEDVVASTESESPDSGEGGVGGLISKAGGFFKSIFSSGPAEE